MSYPTDPIRTWRRRRLGAALIAAPLVLAAIVWASLPRGDPASAAPQSSALDIEQPSLQSATSARPVLDASVFEVQLWNAPISESDSATAANEPPPPAPNLELIAIITEGERHLAALYEVGADRLHILAGGQRLGRLDIVGVSADSVDLRDGARTYRLSLSPSPLRPGSRLSLAPAEESRP